MRRRGGPARPGTEVAAGGRAGAQPGDLGRHRAASCRPRPPDRAAKDEEAGVRDGADRGDADGDAVREVVEERLAAAHAGRGPARRPRRRTASAGVTPPKPCSAARACTAWPPPGPGARPWPGARPGGRARRARASSRSRPRHRRRPWRPAVDDRGEAEAVPATRTRSRRAGRDAVGALGHRGEVHVVLDHHRGVAASRARGARRRVRWGGRPQAVAAPVPGRRRGCRAPRRTARRRRCRAPAGPADSVADHAHRVVRAVGVHATSAIRRPVTSATAALGPGPVIQRAGRVGVDGMTAYRAAFGRGRRLLPAVITGPVPPAWRASGDGHLEDPVRSDSWRPASGRWRAQFECGPGRSARRSRLRVPGSRRSHARARLAAGLSSAGR